METTVPKPPVADASSDESSYGRLKKLRTPLSKGSKCIRPGCDKLCSHFVYGLCHACYFRSYRRTHGRVKLPDRVANLEQRVKALEKILGEIPPKPKKTSTMYPRKGPPVVIPPKRKLDSGLGE